MDDLQRIFTARRRGQERTWRNPYCAAPHVSGKGHWSVGGCCPSMRSEEHDEAHVFRLVSTDSCPYVTVDALRVFIPREQGGYGAADALLYERGYLVPFFKRSHETLERTAERRMRTYRSRVREGLPATVPNAVGLALVSA